MKFYKNKEVCCNRVSLKYFKAGRLHFFKSTERMAKQMLNKNNTTEGIIHYSEGIGEKLNVTSIVHFHEILRKST